MAFSIADADYPIGVSVEFRRAPLTVREIQRTVADHFGVGVRNLTASRGSKHVALARQVAMKMAHEFTPHSSIKIGELFGGRDHSTVLHAYKAIERRVEGDEHFANALAELREIIARTVDKSGKSFLPLRKSQFAWYGEHTVKMQGEMAA